jgi:two-component system osmolarity sensor histidine kinase EnvZ
MNRFGIVARIALIVTAALFLSQLAIVISYVWQSERSPLPPYAIADRITAVVRLLDETAPENRQAALDVASVNGFHVAVLPAVPATFEDSLGFARMRLMTQKMVKAYASDRVVRSGTLDPALRAPGGLKIDFAVGLKTGEAAIFTVSDDTTLRLFNMPIGFIAGFFGVAVALIAVLAVARETRPLVRLAESIDELGNRVEPVEVEEKGARELRTLIRAINNMQERILRLVGNRTLFLGAISHDLKTYLTRFRLRLEMMPPGSHRDRAVVDVEAMEQLLNDALLFAGDASLNSEVETVDLGQVAERCAIEANLPPTQIAYHSAGAALNVRIPERALCRVIDNLVSNAVRYGKRADVRTEQRQGMACLVIEDDGPGIAEDDIASVFEPFFRGEPSRNRAHGGTGLGLSIVRQILDAHGGTIILSNRAKGQGLRATVCLPLAGRLQ